jgi:hypothetical protein
MQEYEMISGKATLGFYYAYRLQYYLTAVSDIPNRQWRYFHASTLLLLQILRVSEKAITASLAT